MSIQLNKTEKTGFGHNISFIEKADENLTNFDLLICCHPTLYKSLSAEFQNLAFPFKNQKIGMVNLNENTNSSLFNNLNEQNPVHIIIGFESLGTEYYQASNLGQLTNNWIIIHPSLAQNQDYFMHLQTDIVDGTKKIRFLGHQTHITPTEGQVQNMEALRLGQIRQNIDMVEPWCRTVDHVIFHSESLRKTDFTAKSHSNPGGFTYEEACKLSQFIGASSHLKSIAYLLPAETALDANSYAVLSQLIWYLIDGYHHYREDKPVEKHKLTQYIVHAAHRDLDINFWKNNDSGRWWMEVPGHENYWISCTYDDYLEASQGEFSSKLIHALNHN